MRTEWQALQESLRLQVTAEDVHSWTLATLRRVGGLDISFDGDTRGTAVLVVCAFDDNNGSSELKLVYEDAIDVDMSLPYVSGFLFVRELPGYRQLLQRLRASAPHLEPDLFLVDGSGMYHPRQLGSASHFAVLEDLCAIGVAKKLMHIDGEFGQPDAEKVDGAELVDFGDSVPIVGSRSGFTYGLALRTTRKESGKKSWSHSSSGKRVYISVGHRVSLDTAREVVLKCSEAGAAYIPEPIRLADLTGRAIERAWKDLYEPSSETTRQLVFDVSNLLDDKQRRTLHGILEGRDAAEKLASIPAGELKRKKAVIGELFEPFRSMHGAASVGQVRIALKMEKPWAKHLAKPSLLPRCAGSAMTTIPKI